MYGILINQIKDILHGIIKIDAQIHKKNQFSVVKNSQLHFMNGESKVGLMLQRPSHYHCQLRNKTKI